jgi:hypothetical protein
MNVSVSPTASSPSNTVAVGHIHRTVIPLFVLLMWKGNDGFCAMFPDTNSFMGYAKEDMEEWIYHLYNKVAEDMVANSGIAVNGQTSTSMTCAQYCVSGLNDVNYAEHQTRDKGSIQLISVHRELMERRVKSVEVFTNNNTQFQKWYDSHKETLRLDLTIQENRRIFREAMGLADVSIGKIVSTA